MNEANLTLDVLTALEAVVLEWQTEGFLNLLTPKPDWFTQLYPETANRAHNYISPEISPFLENFLCDAEIAWAANTGKKHASEIWTETNAAGDEYHLRAIAFTVREKKLVLLSEVSSVFTDRQAILQRAREGALHIHALQRAEQKLRESEATLERARDLALQTARLKAEFLANMSHEIRTPLNGVIGLADLLLDTPLEAEQRSYLHTIQSSGETLLRIVNDILDFSKIEAGKMILESIPFDARALVDSIVTLFQHQAQAKKLQLNAKVDEAVPAVLCGDPVRLRQILLNLTGNALKFTAQGQIEIYLTVKDEDALNLTLLGTVRDTGPGLSAALQTQLFQPFMQADSSTARHHGGTGLGLAICKQLATLMGGDIGVDSELGAGAAFWFTACLEKAPEQMAPANLAAEFRAVSEAREAPYLLTLSAEEVVEPSPEKPRILVAEDNLVNQRVAQKHLAYLGYPVDLADDGQAALAALAQQDYDLIFMDCQMAGLDGFAATAEIRRREGAARHTPIVAMTAHALPGERERCLAAGMDDYLAKPVRRTDFAIMLERWLSIVQRPNAPAQDSRQTEIKFSRETLQQAIGWTREDDPELFGEIVTLFLRGTEERLAALRIGLENQDWEVLNDLCHALRGSCSSLGIYRLEQLCLALEEVAKKAQFLPAKALLGDLENEFTRVNAVLKSVMA